MTLNIVLLLSWTLVDPLRWHRVYTDELNSYGRCSAEGGAWKGFLSALALLNFCALILANVQAYRARSINDELSESKYIGLTTLSMFQIFVVGVPLLAIGKCDQSGAHMLLTNYRLNHHSCANQLAICSLRKPASLLLRVYSHHLHRFFLNPMSDIHPKGG